MASVDAFLATALAASAVRTAFAAGNQQPASPSAAGSICIIALPAAWSPGARTSLLQPAKHAGPSSSRSDMDRGGVAASVVTIPQPWTLVPVRQTRRPGACLLTMARGGGPRPSPRAVCRAAPSGRGRLARRDWRTYDTLKVDGIGLYTSYGAWFGAPARFALSWPNSIGTRRW